MKAQVIAVSIALISMTCLTACKTATPVPGKKWNRSIETSEIQDEQIADLTELVDDSAIPLPDSLEEEFLKKGT